MIAAGGTGGHFFPAEALAAELVARGHRVALMTDARAAARLPESFAGREVFVLRGAGVAGRGLRRGVGAVARLAAGTAQARLILGRLDAAAIVGFGGYPTVAPVLATTLMRDRPPVILHEQNAVLGRANRLLARRATALALSFEHTARVPAGIATTVTGNPVRPAFLRPLPSFTGDGPLIHLLVLGGSLGARVFSDAVPAALAALPPTSAPPARHAAMPGRGHGARGARPTPRPASRPSCRRSSPTSPPAWPHASLVIARAGASTVAELAVAGRPAILVPLPGAIDDHQTANARALAAAGGAWVLPQTEIDTVRDRLASLLAVPDALARAGAAARRFARPDAAARLADLVLAHARVAA